MCVIVVARVGLLRRRVGEAVGLLRRERARIGDYGNGQFLSILQLRKYIYEMLWSVTGREAAERWYLRPIVSCAGKYFPQEDAP